MMILRNFRFISRPLTRHTHATSRSYPRTAVVVNKPWFIRPYATATGADAAIEEIQDLYATAKDEFEIAAEETEKKTVYAADDRAAAQEEFQRLKEAYNRHIKQSDPEVGSEIQRRVGQRIRELDNALTALDEMAMED